MTTDTEVQRANDRTVPPLVAPIPTAGLLIVAAFQGALTLGAPFGAAAMGGTNAGSLPDEVRLVTGLAALVWVLAALVVLAKDGRALVPVPASVARAGTWALVGLLALGSLMNFASPSPWERWGWGPFTLIMFRTLPRACEECSPVHPVPREQR